MRSLTLRCALCLIILPCISSARCTTRVTALKIRIEASGSDKKKLLKDLKEHGCKRGLGIEPIEKEFDYRISLAEIQKPRMTLTQAGIGSAHESVLRTTVFDNKGVVIFEFDRGNRLTRRGALNASAKEIVKRLHEGIRNSAP